MERKNNSRNRVSNLRAVPNRDQSGSSKDGLSGEVMGVTLGDRVVFSEQAEVWSVRGMLKDGTLLKEPVGELSFILIPGTHEPAAAIVGYVAPKAPLTLAADEDILWPQIRSMIVQLGYDIDGYYASISFGGRSFCFEDFNPNR
ncbi:hypothetical protein E3A20_08520 [Planctomyces bekefii]|uniref:Uncharacterized protein n=1 Tax=Planctomyces bekefii TaxID=1653850 RepID=A0A5C6MAZ7_9PLAN|nr:hypothetical protein E3A20_08520 [Planctomyces bekefii]